MADDERAPYSSTQIYNYAGRVWSLLDTLGRRWLSASIYLSLALIPYNTHAYPDCAVGVECSFQSRHKLRVEIYEVAFRLLVGSEYGSVVWMFMYVYVRKAKPSFVD